MGSGNSHVDVSAVSLQWYQASLQHPCLLPDVGVDESLLKFSGINSNTELQAYSSELADKVPDYIEKFVSNFGTFSPIPNAVGLGALMISMILEIVMKSTTTQTNENSYSMLQRVFGEEKASSVRDTMTVCVDRHRTYMNNEQRLAEELRILERTLSGHLATLKNSLLYDGQMSSRGFKIWVNGAYFQVQMLIHETRLSKKPKKAKAEDVKSISALIEVLT
uniref:uncharacterized protein LOC122768352 n=1 Tax=Solea senegalensis TaxID=28829 RepID=UPI001CD902C7|nr:uncharacterized protein LOC122768352 [Solea senegalensis]